MIKYLKYLFSLIIVITIMAGVMPIFGLLILIPVFYKKKKVIIKDISYIRVQPFSHEKIPCSFEKNLVFDEIIIPEAYIYISEIDYFNYGSYIDFLAFNEIFPELIKNNSNALNSFDSSKSSKYQKNYSSLSKIQRYNYFKWLIDKEAHVSTKSYCSIYIKGLQYRALHEGKDIEKILLILKTLLSNFSNFKDIKEEILNIIIMILEQYPDYKDIFDVLDLFEIKTNPIIQNNYSKEILAIYNTDIDTLKKEFLLKLLKKINFHVDYEIVNEKEILPNFYYYRKKIKIKKSIKLDPILKQLKIYFFKLKKSEIDAYSSLPPKYKKIIEHPLQKELDKIELNKKLKLKDIKIKNFQKIFHDVNWDCQIYKDNIIVFKKVKHNEKKLQRAITVFDAMEKKDIKALKSYLSLDSNIVRILKYRKKIMEETVDNTKFKKDSEFVDTFSSGSSGKEIKTEKTVPKAQSIKKTKEKK